MFSILPLISRQSAMDYAWAVSTGISFDTGLEEIVCLRLQLICVVASNNFEVGDLVELGQINGNYSAAAVGLSVSILASGAVYIFVPSGGIVIREPMFGLVNTLLNSTKFQLRVTAYGR